MAYETEPVKALMRSRNSCQLHPVTMHLSLLLLRLFKHLLDDLLFLDQECANDTVLDTAGASRSTVCSLNRLLGAGDVGVFAWSESWDALKLVTTVTTCNSMLAIVLCSTELRVPERTFWCGSLLLDVKVSELSTGCLHNADEVRLGVV